MSAVLTTREGAVATVTLNTPDVRNALGPELIAGVTAAFADLATDDACRVVVMTGAGTAFCAGADLAWMRASRELTEAENIADAGRAQAMLEAVDGCPKAVVARVNGHAMGGGAGLVACADVAVAAEDARFAFSEARLGLIPAMISPYVLRARAIRSARSGRASGAEASRTRRLHSAIASGPAASSWSTQPAVAASSPSTATTSWTSPSRSASVASNTRAVVNRARVGPGPSARRT